MKRNRNKRSIVRDPKFVPLNYCNFYLYYAVTSKNPLTDSQRPVYNVLH